MQILNPAGGLVYHFRAMKHQSLWQPFKDFLRNWLASWPIEKDELILIGPSAGYCLPLNYISGFQSIFIIDTDPLAVLLLKRKLQKLNSSIDVRWSTRDAFSQPPLLSKAKPNTPILFCNVLGQLHLLNSNRAWNEDLRKLISDRPWASFHDRLSGELKPEVDMNRVRNISKLKKFRLENADLLDFYESKDKGATLVDHLAPELGGQNYRYASWEFRPGRYHLIEACTGMGTTL